MFLVSVRSIQGDISSPADKWAKRSLSTSVRNRASNHVSLISKPKKIADLIQLAAGKGA